MDVTVVRRRTTTLLAGIRAGGNDLHRLPGSLIHAASGTLMEAAPWVARPLTVAGAAQVGLAEDRLAFLLPVELRHANHTASTNAGDFTFEILRKP
jgi:hypothetical protein